MELGIRPSLLSAKLSYPLLACIVRGGTLLESCASDTLCHRDLIVQEVVLDSFLSSL